MVNNVVNPVCGCDEPLEDNIDITMDNASQMCETNEDFSSGDFLPNIQSDDSGYCNIEGYGNPG